MLSCSQEPAAWGYKPQILSQIFIFSTTMDTSARLLNKQFINLSHFASRRPALDWQTDGHKGRPAECWAEVLARLSATRRPWDWQKQTRSDGRLNSLVRLGCSMLPEVFIIMHIYLKTSRHGMPPDALHYIGKQLLLLVFTCLICRSQFFRITASSSRDPPALRVKCRSTAREEE